MSKPDRPDPRAKSVAPPETPRPCAAAFESIALLLQTGVAGEIAARVEQVLDDPAQASRLAAAAQAFARETWRWDRQGDRLAAFLARVAR